MRPNVDAAAWTHHGETEDPRPPGPEGGASTRRGGGAAVGWGSDCSRGAPERKKRAAGEPQDPNPDRGFLPRPGSPVPEAWPGRGLWGIRAAGAAAGPEPPEPPQPPACAHAASAFAVAGQRPWRHSPRVGNVRAFSVRGPPGEGLDRRPSRWGGSWGRRAMALPEGLVVWCQALHSHSLLQASQLLFTEVKQLA